MDITMHADAGDFRLRAGGVFLRDGKLLVVREENGDCLIPGGRVRLGETVEEAALREVGEETGISASIRRPLFLNQGFFTAPDGRRQHELSFFFLMDGAKPWEGETVRHGGGRTYRLMWIPLDELGNVPLRPKFLRRGLRILPTEFELLQNFD